MRWGKQGGRDPLWVGVMLTVILVTVARVFCAAKAELLPEEAYYWTYWQHPALSYFDHPPMVAWIIGLGTALFGATELGVRVGMLALSLGSTALLFRIGRIWFDQRVALWATLLFALLPIFIATSLFAFPDGPLIFFWLLTLYAITKAIHPSCAVPQQLTGGRTERVRRTAFWLLAGVALGGALLSKYTAIMLASSLLLFFLFSHEHRHWLRRPQPWIALGLAALLFSPVILWNAQHAWASFRFQASHSDHPTGGIVSNVFRFWWLQVAVLTPMLFALFAVAAMRAIKRGWRQHDDRWNFVASFFFPMFLVFVRASFKTEIHINWTAPAYLSLTLAAAAVFAEGLAAVESRLARRWRISGIVTGGIFSVVLLMAVINLIWGVPKAFAYHHAGGWRELGRVVEDLEHDLEKSTGQRVFTIGADKYNLAAEIGFYTREPEDMVNTYAFGKSGLGFRYWTDLQEFKGLPAVAVLNRLNDGTLAKLSEGFDRVGEPQRIEVAAGPDRFRAVYVVNCYGYRVPSADVP